MEQTKQKKGCSGFAFTLLGIFIGFILTLGLIGGAGYYLYAGVTVNDVEKTFGINLSDIPSDLKNKTIKQAIPMVNEASQLTVNEFSKKYKISLPVKVNVGTDASGNPLEIDLTEALQPLLNAKVVDAFGKINEVLDYFTISNTFNLLKQVNEIPNFNFLNNPQYKDLPITNILSKIDDFTIADLMDSTANLDSGILMHFKNVKLTGMSNENDFQNIINGIKIGDVLQIDSSTSGVMSALSGLTIGNLNDNNIINAIGGLTLEEVLKIDPSTTGVIAEIKTLTINQIKNGEINNAIKDLTLSQVMDINETSGIIYDLKDVRIKNLTTEYIMNNITIGSALNIEPSATGILGAIKTWKLADLTEVNIKTIKVGDALNISATATGILGALKDLTIGDLGSESAIQNAIKTLTIGEVINIEAGNVIFDKLSNLQLKDLTDTNVINAISTLKVKDIINDNTSTNKIWNIIKESQLNSISTTIDNLKLSDVVEFNWDSDGNGTADSYKGFLSFLIDTTHGKDPKITELGTSIDSAIDSYINDYFSKATIQDLVDAGILNINTHAPNYSLIKDRKAKDVFEELINATL